jgi:16S rRNA processing protein RimM
MMELVEIGYFSKTQGTKGHVVLRSEFDFDEEAVKAFFVDSGGSKAPLFISEINVSNKGIVVLFEEINSIEKARTFIGKKVYMDAAFILEDNDKVNWLDFELIDEVAGSLGQIVGVSDNGHQLLVNLNYKGKEIILPLVEEFILSIDEVKKKIFYKAPEGLIDLYLQD